LWSILLRRVRYKKLVTQLEKKRSDKHFSNLAADAIDEHDQCNSNWHEELEMLVEKFSDLGFSQDLSVLNQHQLFQLYLTLKRLRAENG